MEWLVVSTSRYMDIFIIKVIANDHDEAITKAGEVDAWEQIIYDDPVLEGLDIYPSDIQATQIDKDSEQ